MKASLFKSVLLGSSAAAIAGAAFAQETAAPVPDDEIIVTGVAKAGNKLETSISVSTLGVDEIANNAPRGTSEIFRYLPGIRAESSAGGGNSNIAVRGMPLSTGGAKYLSLQDEGLPILLFGDIDFAPADGFYKADSTLARVESVRGGSASTLATNGPGGIINFIHKTGADEGGSATFTTGLGYNDFRGDFEYGGPINDSMYFHVGGHYQVGGDYRDTGLNAVKGGQVRASVTKEFESGLVRLWARFLDKNDATFLPQPVGLSGRRVSGSIPGLSANNETLISAFSGVGVDDDSERRIHPYNVADGFSVQSKQVGGEFSFDVGHGMTISNKFRYADTSGDFSSPFAHQVTDADRLIATSFGGAAAQIVNGPFAGQLATSANLQALTGNNLITEIAYFDTELDDMSNFANELKINRVFDFDGGSLDVTAGYFKMHQEIGQDWHWNQFLVTTDPNAALINVAGFTDAGILGYNRGFGWNGNNRLYDIDYDVDAPFVAATLSMGNFNLDASVRHEIMNAGGFGLAASGRPFDVDGDGIIDPPEADVSITDASQRFIQNFDTQHTAYSIGANYVFDDSLSVFARYSKGASFNGERKFFGDQIDRLTGEIKDDNSFVDTTRQIEGGLKWSEDAAVPGDLDLYLTFFHAKTEESNFEITTFTSLDNKYRSLGLEAEFAYSSGGFNLLGSATWTDAEITDTASGANIGNTPRRQADLIYNITPSFTFGERFTLGANVNGTTKTFVDDDNNLIMPGFTTVSLFGSINISDRTSLSVNANNVFDEIGFTEAENGRVFNALTPLDTTNDVIVARSITGRTISLSLTHRF
jgi:outer membrane receptor protein involved in Fe transport